MDYESLRKIACDSIPLPSFLAKLWSNPKLNDKYREKVILSLEKMQVEYGKYVSKFNLDPSMLKNSVDSFVKTWCTKDGKVNQRCVRELGSVIKNIQEQIKKEMKIKEELEKEKEAKTRKLTNDDKPLTLF